MIRKVKKLIQRKKIFALGFAFSVLLLSQNSNSSDIPTDYDISNELNSAFSECESLSISGITKINSFQENVNVHLVSIKYEITSEPLFVNKELWGNFKDRKKDIEEKYESYQSEKKLLNPQENNSDFYKKNSEVIENIRTLEKEKAEIRRKMSKNFLRDCNYNNNQFVLKNLNFLFGNYENYGMGVKASFEANIKMLKTDNGWALMSNYKSSRVSVKSLFPLTDDGNSILWKKNIDSNPEKFISECKRVEKDIAVEYEGLSSKNAEKQANENCHSLLQTIKSCLKNNDIQSCYKEFEESSSDL